jgi:hypothetical protein
VQTVLKPVVDDLADMVVGERQGASSSALNDLHRFGNRAIGIVNLVFRTLQGRARAIAWSAISCARCR